jgi:hypothetical protein
MTTLVLVVVMILVPFLVGLTASGITIYRNRERK